MKDSKMPAAILKRKGGQSCLKFEASKKRVKFEGDQEQVSTEIQDAEESTNGAKVVEVDPASRSD